VCFGSSESGNVCLKSLSAGSATQITAKKPPKPAVSKLPPVGAGTGSGSAKPPKPPTPPKTGSSGHIEVYPEN
jgi:hypothetical protein